MIGDFDPYVVSNISINKSTPKNYLWYYFLRLDKLPLSMTNI